MGPDLATPPCKGAGVGNSVFDISSEAHNVTLRGLRITGGGDDLGGGVCHQGDLLTMTNCTLTGNHANSEGGGLCNDTGCTAFLTGCTITGNTSDGIGGGLGNLGTMSLTSCVVNGNTASDTGGGIYNAGAATINATSVTGNTSAVDGGGIFNEDPGTVNLQNGSSVSGNMALAEPNCGGDPGYTDPGGACAS